MGSTLRSARETCLDSRRALERRVERVSRGEERTTGRIFTPPRPADGLATHCRMLSYDFLTALRGFPLGSDRSAARRLATCAATIAAAARERVELLMAERRCGCDFLSD